MARALLVVTLVGATTANAGVNEFTLTGTDGGYITAIAAQPDNANIVLAGSARGIHRSTNGGATWTQIAPAMIGTPTHIAFDPGSPTRVFVLNRQVFVSEDSGQSFAMTTELSIGLDYLAVSGDRVYVGALNGNIYRSDDGGLHFSQVNVPWPAPNARMHTIGADPSDDDVLYACVEGMGTFKTIDHGETWILRRRVSAPARVNSTRRTASSSVRRTPASCSRRPPTASSGAPMVAVPGRRLRPSSPSWTG